MDQLIQLVSSKAGIGEDQATQAVQTVVGFLKERLPAPIAGQLDSVLQGDGRGREEGGGAADVAGKLGL